MSKQMTSSDIRNATSLPVSAVGPMQLDWLDGLTIESCGPGHVLANRSLRKGSAPGFRMKGTFGHSGETLSPSDVLQRSLESRLQTRLCGSKRCDVIWSKWVTPWGQSRSRPRARAATNSETDTGLWPALRAHMTGAPSTKRAMDKNLNFEVAFSRAMIAAGQGGLLDGAFLTPAFLLSLMRYPPAWASTAPSET